MFGTDLSQHNILNSAQFAKLKASGIEFVTLRASIGDDEDDRVEQHAQLAKDAGMLVGAYHWLRPGPSTGAQVDRFLKTAEKVQPNWYVLDVEEEGTTEWDVARFYAAFGDQTFQKLGLYTNPAWLARLPNVAPLFSLDWIARYIEPQETIWLSSLDTIQLVNAPSRLWQFSQRLTFTTNGVRTAVDADVFDGDEVDLLRYTGAIS
jgi:GH25 family lysozyme M1 (1,4-beta-N-acetylmuramidase)